MGWSGCGRGAQCAQATEASALVRKHCCESVVRAHAGGPPSVLPRRPDAGPGREPRLTYGIAPTAATDKSAVASHELAVVDEISAHHDNPGELPEGNRFFSVRPSSTSARGRPRVQEELDRNRVCSVPAVRLAASLSSAARPAGPLPSSPPMKSSPAGRAPDGQPGLTARAAWRGG